MKSFPSCCVGWCHFQKNGSLIADAFSRRNPCTSNTINDSNEIGAMFAAFFYANFDMFGFQFSFEIFVQLILYNARYGQDNVIRIHNCEQIPTLLSEPTPSTDIFNRQRHNSGPTAHRKNWVDNHIIVHHFLFDYCCRTTASRGIYIYTEIKFLKPHRDSVMFIRSFMISILLHKHIFVWIMKSNDL